MVALTTAARVRNRINASISDIADAIIEEYIEDVQAVIETYAETTFAASDDLFNIARSVCTDRAACRALIYILDASSSGISYSIDELSIDKTNSNKASLLEIMSDRAEKNILLLKPRAALTPKSSTS